MSDENSRKANKFGLAWLRPTNLLPKSYVTAFGTLAVIWLVGVLTQGILAGYNRTLFRADFTTSGTFGDSFGGLSAMMATAAAIGAWQAVSYQKRELDSVNNREKSLDAEARKRDFEATFFRLLDTFQRVENQTRVDRVLRNRTGKEAFSLMLSDFNKEIEKPNSDRNLAYALFFEQYRDNLAHYFRLIYNIILFAERDRKTECYFYVKLIRSILSEPELIMVGLNGMYHLEGYKNFKPLIERFSLLDNISDNAKAYYGFDEVYKPEAFDSDLRPAQNKEV